MKSEEEEECFIKAVEVTCGRTGGKIGWKSEAQEKLTRKNELFKEFEEAGCDDENQKCIQTGKKGG